MNSKHRPFTLLSSAVLAGVLALSPSLTAANKTITLHPSQLAPLGGGFAEGFRAGYQKANPMGMCPIPPIPPIGQDSYQDGFGLGYAQGMIDKR